jgi:hypothetical protein
MHDEKRDQFVDDLLEASLKRYHSEEPRSGMEMRILGGVRTRERAARRRGLAWAVAACVGTLAIIVFMLHSVPTRNRQAAPSAALPLRESGARRAALQPAVAQQPLPSLGAHRAPLQMRGPVARVRRVVTHRSRPEQFPTPLPLTEQEKLLLVYLNKATKTDLAAETNQTDETPVSDMEIPRIKIAALEIKPLDDSQSEQEK